MQFIISMTLSNVHVYDFDYGLNHNTDFINNHDHANDQNFGQDLSQDLDNDHEVFQYLWRPWDVGTLVENWTESILKNRIDLTFDLILQTGKSFILSDICIKLIFYQVCRELKFT